MPSLNTPLPPLQLFPYQGCHCRACDCYCHADRGSCGWWHMHSLSLPQACLASPWVEGGSVEPQPAPITEEGWKEVPPTPPPLATASNSVHGRRPQSPNWLSLLKGGGGREPPPPDAACVPVPPLAKAATQAGGAAVGGPHAPSSFPLPLSPVAEEEGGHLLFHLLLPYLIHHGCWS